MSLSLCSNINSPDCLDHAVFCRLSMPPVLLAFCCHFGVQVERGRQDALAWSEAVGFTRNGCPLFPTVQQAEALRWPLFAPSWQCAESFWHL